MDYGEIAGINKPIARIIQGTTMFGGDMNQDESFALLDQVYQLGCNTIDTANVYGGGQSERIVGNWMQARDLRDKIVIITKGGAHSEDRRRTTPFDITSDLFESLARLKTEYVDLYLLHRDNPDVPVGPIVNVLNEHLQAGRIHALGVSNWTQSRIEDAAAYAHANGLTAFVASSPQFSLADSHAEPWPLCVSLSGDSGLAARKWYADIQMPLLAWSPLASGFFSGRFQRGNLHDFGEREWDEVVVRTYASEANFQRYDRAGILAGEKGVSVAQVALAFVMNQPMNLFAVVGPHSGRKFKENIEAVNIRLTQQEMAWLDLKMDNR